MSPTDVPSPGGWLNLWNARVARKVVIGLLATYAGVSVAQGALDVYGKFQGGQAAHYCEMTLTSQTAKTVTYACLNPLPENQTGGVLMSLDDGVFIREVPSPVTRLDVGTASGATYSGQNIFNNVNLDVRNRFYSTRYSGAYLPYDPPIVAPRNYTGQAKRYITATFSAGSGQTVGAHPPAVLRLKVTPVRY